MGFFNSTCPIIEKPSNTNTSLIQNGNVVLQQHEIGFIIAGAFTVIAVMLSAWIIRKHLMFYTHRKQQRCIVRILLLPPVYAIMSWLSYFFWPQALYFQLVRDCYDAVVIAAFFFLLVAFLGETPEDVRAVFRNVQFDKWVFPLGFVRYKPSGLHCACAARVRADETVLQLCKWLILQFVVVYPLTTLAAVITDATGLYCETSWMPNWAHVYLSVIDFITVSIAMYALLQFYVTMHEELKPFGIVSKFLAIKLIVFFAFWQEVLFSVLEHFNVIRETTFWSADNVVTGISTICCTTEMALFAGLHIYAFSYKPYRPAPDLITGRRLKTSKWAAILHVFNFRDFAREIRDGTSYAAKQMAGRPVEADRRGDFIKALGRVRADDEKRVLKSEYDVTTDLEQDLRLLRDRDADATPMLGRAEADGTRHLGDDDDYSLKSPRYSMPQYSPVAVSADGHLPTLAFQPRANGLQSKKEGELGFWGSLRRQFSYRRGALDELADGYDPATDSDSPFLSPHPQLYDSPQPMSQIPSVGQAPSLAFVPSSNAPLAHQLKRASAPSAPSRLVMPSPLSPSRYPSTAPSRHSVQFMERPQSRSPQWSFETY